MRVSVKVPSLLAVVGAVTVALDTVDVVVTQPAGRAEPLLLTMPGTTGHRPSGIVSTMAMALSAVYSLERTSSVKCFVPLVVKLGSATPLTIDRSMAFTVSESVAEVARSAALATGP